MSEMGENLTGGVQPQCWKPRATSAYSTGHRRLRFICWPDFVLPQHRQPVTVESPAVWDGPQSAYLQMGPRPDADSCDCKESCNAHWTKVITMAFRPPVLFLMVENPSSSRPSLSSSKATIWSHVFCLQLHQNFWEVRFQYPRMTSYKINAHLAHLANFLKKNLCFLSKQKSRTQ